MRKLILFSFILFFSVFTNVYAANQNDPVMMLQNIADNMIKELKAHQATLKTKPQIVYKLAYQYVVPHADLPTISRNVLTPQVWNSATEAQRNAFQKAFTITLIRTYSSALTAYQDQKIFFYPVRGGVQGLQNIEVNSRIEGSGQPINISYRLTRVNGAWKVVDLSVEHVSMLESFKSQFASILAEGNMDLLLKRMSNHNNRS